jgi:hypothetical protein
MLKHVFPLGLKHKQRSCYLFPPKPSLSAPFNSHATGSSHITPTTSRAHFPCLALTLSFALSRISKAKVRQTQPRFADFVPVPEHPHLYEASFPILKNVAPPPFSVVLYGGIVNPFSLDRPQPGLRWRAINKSPRRRFLEA